jgi:hypothetical protein
VRGLAGSEELGIGAREAGRQAGGTHWHQPVSGHGQAKEAAGSPKRSQQRSLWAEGAGSDLLSEAHPCGEGQGQDHGR